MTTKWIVIGLYLFVSAVHVCSGQEEMIRAYTIGDGLVMNRVRGFHQDASGFIWIYTWDGLSRYEGNRFRNYISGKELNHGLINDIIEFPEGNLYIALNNGTVEVIRDLVVQPDLRIAGPTINIFFRTSNDQVLAGTDDIGLCLFDGNTCKPLSPVKNEAGILNAWADNDYLFIECEYSLGVYKIKFGEADSIKPDIQLIKSWNSESTFFECIFKDHQGHILIGTGEGIMQIDNLSNTGEDFHLREPDFLKSDFPWKNWRVHDIAQSEDGTFWIGTTNGLVKLSPSNHWTVLTTKDDLPSDNITSLLIDRSHILWIGTELGAASINLTNTISQYKNPNCQKLYFIFPAPDNMLYCICDLHSIQLLDSSGVLRESRNVSNAFGLVKKNDELYVVTNSGVDPLSFDWPGENNVKQLPASTNYIVQNNGKIYWQAGSGINCCTASGLCRLAEGINYRVETLSGFRGNKLLLGTWADGLFLTVADNDQKSCHLKIINDLTKWLPGKEIRSIMVSTDGAIWVGTRYHGLIRLHCNPDFTSCDTEVFNITNGLISNWIYALAEDHLGNIWVGSISGIDKIIPEGDSHRVFSYSKVFGLYGIVGQFAITDDNTIWVRFSTGLARIKDGHNDNLPPAQAYITSAVLGGNNQIHQLSNIVSLPFDRNSANFSFAAPDYLSQTQLQFTYRLLGAPDTSWSASDAHHQIFYGNLFPGQYKFEVAAYGWNGERGHPASFQFEIRPPFWRQFWFISIVILCVTAIFYGLYRFRIAQINRLQVVRDRIASDLHDDIGSSLSHVNILSELGRQELLKSHKSVEILERIGIEAQYSSEALDDIIWSVKSKSDFIGNVIGRMRQYATELFDSAGINFKITEEISADQPLEMEFRRDLYLAYKELLRNIVRHAKATQVDIGIVIKRDVVQLSIRDNGKGFDVNEPTQRSGIMNIKERARRWRGHAEWKSAPGMGSHVSLVMKQK